MNKERLQTLTEEISMRVFHRPFRHQALFNPRLRTTGGRYLLRSHNIEINKKYFDEGGMEVLIGIIKHELCHYHLHLEGKGHQHRDADFRKLLKETGAPRFCEPLKSTKEARRRSSKNMVYRCKDCGIIYNRKRRINTARYVCGKCRGRLVFVEEIKPS